MTSVDTAHTPRDSGEDETFVFAQPRRVVELLTNKWRRP